MPKTLKGSKVALLSMVPALVSSTNPIIEASAVPLTICTEKPTVGGIETRKAWGNMTHNFIITKT